MLTVFDEVFTESDVVKDEWIALDCMVMCSQQSAIFRVPFESSMKAYDVYPLFLRCPIYFRYKNRVIMKPLQ